jgi:hypothetical protein
LHVVELIRIHGSDTHHVGQLSQGLDPAPWSLDRDAVEGHLMLRQHPPTLGLDSTRERVLTVLEVGLEPSYLWRSEPSTRRLALSNCHGLAVELEHDGYGLSRIDSDWCYPPGDRALNWCGFEAILAISPGIRHRQCHRRDADRQSRRQKDRSGRDS